jgi:hypothetical protein
VEVTWAKDLPQVELLLAPQSVNIYRIVRAKAAANPAPAAGTPPVPVEPDGKVEAKDAAD